MQNWLADLMLSEKYYMYKHFKINFAAEKYLTCLPSNMRILMTKFRICNARLPIEQGHYCNAHVTDKCPHIGVYRNTVL